ncbi:uncharacterized protein LOC117648433 [Thrips palmi]|uniref:Uncharacterized protein LOC117648433 n=1 Tax=Thrips palmi TaxID=161013 RepID=A0A6P8Z2W8_THRPL|nr:uncharacterized protein LOC117648433 [Thrips palmi]
MASAMWSRAAEESVDRVWEYYLPVRAQEQARVAFGSAQSRAVLPLAGPGGGASRLALLAVKATDDLDHLGPAKYTTPTLGALHDVLTRVTTKRPDVGPGGSTAPRFREVDQHLPAPNTYQLPSRRPATPSKAPFNTTTTRRPLVTSNTPGPGSYNPGAFSQPGVAVVVRCGQGDGPGRCEACQEELAAEFWSLDGHVVQGLPRDALMCQACMQSARALLRAAGARSKTRFTRWQLDAFKKTRDCSDIHRHEGTKSKISLVDPKTVAKRRRKEAYLAKYFRDQAVVNPNLMAGTEPAKLTEAEVDAGRGPRPDAFCCLHEAFNSFNKDNMSFGLRSLRVPSDVLYNTMRRCALDFHPSRSSSTRTSVRESVRGSVRESTTRRPSRTN